MLLALPKPGPPLEDSLARTADSAPRMLPRLRPNSEVQPTRSRSRREKPSQVSLPEEPGITNMVRGPFGAGSPCAGPAGRWDSTGRAGGILRILYGIGNRCATVYVRRNR